MIAVGMLGAWAGYALATWGYILVRGWDVPFQQWVSPIRPYTWPKPPGQPPLIPDDQLTPRPADVAAEGGGVPVTGGRPGHRAGKGRPGRTSRPGGPKTGP